MTFADNLWERLSDLHGRSLDGHFVDENPLGEIVPSGVLDRGGCLVSTAERLAHAPHFAVAWLAEGLGLGDKEHWRKLRPSCIQAVRQLFAGKSNLAAWIHFQTSRAPITVQAPEMLNRELGTTWDVPGVKGTRGNYRFRSINRAASEIALPLRSLEFVNAEGMPGTRLVQIARTRDLTAPTGYISGVFDTWCVADPHDDQQSVAAGWVPAGYPLRIENEVNTGMLMDFVCLHLTGEADALTLELHPHTAQLVSVRRARVPLELLLRCHQRYHDCLRQAIGEDPQQFSTFPREIERLMWLMSNPSSVSFKLITSLRVLLCYVEAGSLNEAGKKAGISDHSNARRHLDNLAGALGVELVTSSVGNSHQRNSSQPTPVAMELAMWVRSRIPFPLQ